MQQRKGVGRERQGELPLQQIGQGTAESYRQKGTGKTNMICGEEEKNHLSEEQVLNFMARDQLGT